MDRDDRSTIIIDQQSWSRKQTDPHCPTIVHIVTRQLSTENKSKQLIKQVSTQPNRMWLAPSNQPTKNPSVCSPCVTIALDGPECVFVWNTRLTQRESTRRKWANRDTWYLCNRSYKLTWFVLFYRFGECVMHPTRRRLTRNKVWQSERRQQSEFFDDQRSIVSRFPVLWKKTNWTQLTTYHWPSANVCSWQAWWYSPSWMTAKMARDCYGPWWLERNRQFSINWSRIRTLVRWRTNSRLTCW